MEQDTKYCRFWGGIGLLWRYGDEINLNILDNPDSPESSVYLGPNDALSSSKKVNRNWFRGPDSALDKENATRGKIQLIVPCPLTSALSGMKLLVN